MPNIARSGFHELHAFCGTSPSNPGLCCTTLPVLTLIFGPFNEHLCSSGKRLTARKTADGIRFRLLSAGSNRAYCLLSLKFASTLQREMSWQGTNLSCRFSCFSFLDAALHAWTIIQRSRPSSPSLRHGQKPLTFPPTKRL